MAADGSVCPVLIVAVAESLVDKVVVVRTCR